LKCIHTLLVATSADHFEYLKESLYKNILEVIRK